MIYTAAFVPLAKEERVLQGVIDKLTETVRCHGMEMNVEKTKKMGISKQPFTVQIMIDQKQLENVGYFMIKHDERCIREIKSRIAMAKETFNSKLDLNI